jgi:hypothetical protein
VPILTTQTDDRPIRLAAHKQHLFLDYRGGVLANCSFGEPYQRDITTGALISYAGQEITDLLSDVLGVLVVFCRNGVRLLYGDDAENLSISPLSDESGAVDWTAQRLARRFYVDDAGMRDMSATQAYGDFRMGSVTEHRPSIRSIRTRRKTAICARIGPECDKPRPPRPMAASLEVHWRAPGFRLHQTIQSVFGC